MTKKRTAGPTKAARKTAKKSPFDTLPPEHDWRTSDADERLKRQKRAAEEAMRITPEPDGHPVFGRYAVRSSSGASYTVEIRDLVRKHVACTCRDFRQNGLGTCKHVEAVKLYLGKRQKIALREATKDSSPYIDLALDREADTLRIERHLERLPARWRRMFDADTGQLRAELDAADTATILKDAEGETALRVSIEIDPWLASRTAHEESRRLRRDYESKVSSGHYPPHETTVPLFPYQREGMLHLAFARRALLADEMGLGKTIQAIAACALLHRLGQAKRALIVAPASLKAEWEEQIQKFTTLASRIVYGGPKARLDAYTDPEAPFFTIVNYEQARVDTLNINHYLKPDIVILDEAQRIKNWASLTARAIKRLESSYAFVLTGTPIENRIDDLYSIVEYLDPQVLGPLFRFNRAYYSLDERGRPSGYKNLRELHERVAPLMLRRRKAQVETELPDRTDHNLFVELSLEQKEAYGFHAEQIAKLRAIAAKRPLTREQQDRLMKHLGMARMVCDTCYILDPTLKACPKLKELMAVLEECLADDDVKVVVFSEWVRMLELVQGALSKAGIGYATHTGRISQQQRRLEIRSFKEDPDCRVLLCTESGGAGLNLQVASVVVNLDLPWNPAKFEQRVARAWRKRQMRPVTVLNFISANTIEHGMLATLGAKRDLSEGVLDLASNLDDIAFKGGSQNFLKRLEQTLSAVPTNLRPQQPVSLPPAAARPDAFAQRCKQLLGDFFISCEERYPLDAAGSSLLVVVEREAERWQPRLNELRETLFGEGKWSASDPVRLHVIDRAAAAALEEMEKAGLVQITTRGRRLLSSKAESPDDAPTLSPETLQRIAAFQTEIKRKSQAVALLLDNGFADMARPALEALLLPCAKVLALRKGLPEPNDIAAANEPPLNRFLPEDLLTTISDGASNEQIRSRLAKIEKLVAS